MEDSLACDNGLLDRFLLSKDQNTWQIIQEWAIIEEKLKKIYFFTEQQISSVFHQNHYRDILSFDQIIDDVELQYKNFPLGISINQYLYETLMSFETPSLETIEENMYRGILNLPEKYIDVSYSHIINYDYFKKSCKDTNECVCQNIKTQIEKHIQDFFLVHVDEDCFLSDKDKHRLPKTIDHFLWFSEYKWINFYIFVQKNWDIRLVPGVSGWSTWRANDVYFGEVFDSLHAKKITLALSSFVSND